MAAALRLPAVRELFARIAAEPTLDPAARELARALAAER